MGISSTQYKDIMYQYDQTRMKNQRKLDERYETLYKKFPELKEIHDHLVELSIRQARMEVLNPESAKTNNKDYLKAQSDLLAKKAEILRENGYPADYLNSIFTCKDCKDTGFLVNDEVITGNQLCLALFAQGVLDDNPQEIAALRTGGSAYAFQFIREKISNLELTPAQLALDPCTAGVVVTDIRTGEVKALVTYPSYDNNQMSGSVDAAYFAQLQDDLSKPLYNNATQALKAPGSTFKPITAVAALEEGVIGLTDTIECTGIYDQVSNPIKCWIWPGRHNAENIEEGIQNSCNYFFL